MNIADKGRLHGIKDDQMLSRNDFFRRVLFVKAALLLAMCASPYERFDEDRIVELLISYLPKECTTPVPLDCDFINPNNFQHIRKDTLISCKNVINDLTFLINKLENQETEQILDFRVRITFSEEGGKVHSLCLGEWDGILLNCIPKKYSQELFDYIDNLLY